MALSGSHPLLLEANDERLPLAGVNEGQEIVWPETCALFMDKRMEVHLVGLKQGRIDNHGDQPGWVIDR